MECHDVSADLTTEGLALVGQANESIFELCEENEDLNVDIDWLAVDLEYGQTYLFFMNFDGTAPTVQPTLGLYDRKGHMEERFDGSGGLWFQHTARYTGRHFIEAFQGSLLTKTVYSVTAALLTDDGKGSAPAIRLDDGYSKYDALELAGDSDTFDFEVFAGRTYYFIANGVEDRLPALNDPFLELRRDGSVIASDDNSGNGNSAVIQFTATAREVLQVTVSGTETGSYEVIGLVADEAAGDSSTGSVLTFDANGRAVKQGYVSQYMDFDWHRVNLFKGEIVKVTMRGTGIDFLATPTLIFRDTNQNVIESGGIQTPTDDGGLLEFYYVAEETGDHFVIARTKLDSWNGQYEVAVEKLRAPAEAVNLFGRGATSRLLVADDATIPLRDLLDTKGLQPYSYEVYSSIPLMRDGISMPANQTYGIIAGNIDLWSIQEQPGSGPPAADLVMRAWISNNWSEWQKFAIVGTPVDENLDSGLRWEGSDPVTYNFVSSEPAYYDADEFGNFTGLSFSSGLGREIDLYFRSLPDLGLERQFELVAPGASADISIFMGDDVGRPFQPYLPGAGRGGDLIFSEADFSGELDQVDRFRILQAVGHALGLNFVNSNSRQSTVMSSVAHPNGLVPGTFGTDDLIALHSIYGNTLLDPADVVADPVNFVLRGSNNAFTIASEARNIIVGADVTNFDFTIDLRDGGRSYARTPGVVTSEVYVGHGAHVFSGVGGAGDDFLFGNGLANVLQGGDGRDFLTGFENDDIFIGGLGDDVFIHYFGDGSDFISDQGGSDTLCFIGRGEFEVDDLLEDYLFSRNGNRMAVSLTLDGGAQEGSVLIDTGVNQANLVESLELWHEGTLTNRISLFSIWNGLSDGESAGFQLGTGSDDYGLLAVKV